MRCELDSNTTGFVVFCIIAGGFLILCFFGWLESIFGAWIKAKYPREKP